MDATTLGIMTVVMITVGVSATIAGERASIEAEELRAQLKRFKKLAEGSSDGDAPSSGDASSSGGGSRAHVDRRGRAR